MSSRGWVGAALFVILGGLVVVGVVSGNNAHSGFAITLPLLAMFGVLVLLMALALSSIAFAIFDLADKHEALALPAGSIRAVIALALVVIFAILTVFLYADLSAGSSNLVVGGLTSDQQQKFVLGLSPDERTRIYVAATPVAGGGQAYNIYRREVPNQAAQDFAKQLLIMLGTLMTSVTGFYFGAKTAQTAAEKPGQADQKAGDSTTPSPTQPTGEPSKLAPSPTVVATAEAAALGHDPSLASDSSGESAPPAPA